MNLQRPVSSASAYLLEYLPNCESNDDRSSLGPEYRKCSTTTRLLQRAGRKFNFTGQDATKTKLCFCFPHLILAVSVVLCGWVGAPAKEINCCHLLSILPKTVRVTFSVELCRAVSLGRSSCSSIYILLSNLICQRDTLPRKALVVHTLNGFI